MSNRAKYVILFYVGFTTYITIETLFRGYSYALMGFDGAILFILFDKINEYLPWDMDLLYQGFIGSMMVTFSELIIGFGLDFFSLQPMWDYSEHWMNFNGYICPLFSFIWVLLAIIGIILADCINYYLLWNGDRPKYKLFGFIRFEFPERKCYC